MPRIKINDKNYETDTLSGVAKAVQSALPAGDTVKFN